MKRILSRESLIRLLLVVVGIVAALVVGEFGLRAYYALSDRDGKYYVWPPNMQKVFRPTPGTMPGVGGPTVFRVNSDGIRGDELAADYEYRILAVGGSTTECLFLDQEVSWPYALQKKLNNLKGPKAWVGNAGKAGLSTREHYMHVKYLLPQFSKVDAVVILAGFNDLIRRLIEDEKYDPLFLQHYDYWEPRLIRGAFSETPYYKGKYRFRTGYYDESAVGSLVVRLKYLYSRRELVQDESGSIFINFRNLRKNAKEFVDDLPDLSSGLEEYETNLGRIIDMVRARSIRIVFMTQPTMYRPDMTQEEKALLWCGWIESTKSGRYYSEKALAAGIKNYNETLLRVCRARGVECIDLASMIPKNTTAFYDDVHFNDRGSLMTAEIIAQYLGHKEPFNKREPRGSPANR